MTERPATEHEIRQLNNNQDQCANRCLIALALTIAGIALTVGLFYLGFHVTHADIAIPFGIITGLVTPLAALMTFNQYKNHAEAKECVNLAMASQL